MGANGSYPYVLYMGFLPSVKKKWDDRFNYKLILMKKWGINPRLSGFILLPYPGCLYAAWPAGQHGKTPALQSLQQVR